MASKICPACRQLNASTEKRCFACGVPLTGFGYTLARYSQRQHFATRLLVGICLVNFLVMTLLGRGLPLAIFGRGPLPSTILGVGGIVGSVGASTEIFRWLSAVYVHLGVLHLGMNMWALLWLGKAIEDSMGWWKMTTVFVIAGIGGFALSRVYYGPTSPPTAGASGAIFGLLGAQIAELHHAKDPRLKDILLQYGAYAIAFALLWPVNNAAHLGGFLTGFLAARGLIRLPRGVAWEGLGARLAALLVLASIAAQVAAFLSPEPARMRQLEARIQRLSGGI